MGALRGAQILYYTGHMNDFLSLDGKEYLTVREAAHYCCVSESHFRAHIGETGIVPGRLWGKIVYRRSDLRLMIEREAWVQSNTTARHSLHDKLVQVPPPRRVKRT